MILGDPRTAAELVRADGVRFYFDDIGCMIAFEHELGVAPRHAWVHDASGPSWIDAEQARYVAGEATPMDYGYVASASGGDRSFESVRAAVVARLVESRGERGIP